MGAVTKYIVHRNSDPDYLMHYGVKGMKWRRHKSGYVSFEAVTSDKIDNVDKTKNDAKKKAEKKAKSEKNKSKGKSKVNRLSKKQLRKYTKQVSRGTYGNGAQRIAALRKKGVSAKDINRIQGRVNKQYGISGGASQQFKQQVKAEFAAAKKAKAAKSTKSTSTTKKTTSTSRSTKSTTKTTRKSSGSRKRSSNKSTSASQQALEKLKKEAEKQANKANKTKSTKKRKK